MVILHDLLEMEPYLPKAIKGAAKDTNGGTSTGSGTSTPEEEIPYPPMVRLSEKVEEQLRQKLARTRAAHPRRNP